MKPKYHFLITKEAIGDYFSPENLKTILISNKKQDSLIGLIAHDEFHFDNNKFLESYAYIESQRNLCIKAICGGKQKNALIAYGRICHTVQDFYAHSNFITLWINNFHGELPNLNSLDCVSNEILQHPDLMSHQTNFPGDYLALIPGIARFLKPHLPKSSHTCMNLDSPDSGENFSWAYHAAVLRTKYELDKLFEGVKCPQNNIDLFFGHNELRN